MAVENRVGLGTPDVNCTAGWVELKWLRCWPVRKDTIVRIDHFTVQQRIWLRRRWQANRGAWLLLQCRREWLLFTGEEAAEHVGKVDREGLYKWASIRWTQGLKRGELGEALTADWDSWRGSRLVRPSSSSVAAEISAR